MGKLTSEQKNKVLEALREFGTLLAAAKAGGVTKQQLNSELKKSAILRKRVNEAKILGKQNIADNALSVIMSYAYGNSSEKTDRNKLTAAIALANAFEPGFRGTSKVEGKIEHDVRVITAIPRPRYDELPNIKVLDKPKTKTVRTEIKDDKGNLLAIKSETVEEAIEGEIIKDVK